MTNPVAHAPAPGDHVTALHRLLQDVRVLCDSENPIAAGTGRRVWSILADCAYELDLDLDLPPWLRDETSARLP